MTPAVENNPLVSVIVPTRNRGSLLGELIESLWAQTLDPARFEIIVADNRSTDNTAELMSELQQKSPCRFKFMVMEENRGPVHSRNQAVRVAQGDILADVPHRHRPLGRDEGGDTPTPLENIEHRGISIIVLQVFGTVHVVANDNGLSGGRDSRDVLNPRAVGLDAGVSPGPMGCSEMTSSSM